MIVQTRRDFNYLLLITLVTIYVWRPLLNMVLQWEGYLYLIPDDVDQYIHNIRSYITYFNVQGMVLGSALTKIFGTNMTLYFSFELVSILFINLSIFFLTKTLTKNSFTAFLASIMFATNYFALADMFRPNTYAGVFLERLPFNIPLMMYSFILLDNYLEKNKIHLYMYSMVIYIVAIFISHFSIYFAFLFFLYPLCTMLYRSRTFKVIRSGILLTLPYILTVVFFLSNQADGLSPIPKRNLVDFLFAPQTSHYPETIVRQLTYISQFPLVVKALITRLPAFAFSSPTELAPFVFPMIIIYSASFIFVFVKERQHRPLLFSLLFASIAVFFSNTLIATRLDVFHDAGSSRYYLIPSIFLSIFWALVLSTYFAKKHIIAFFIVLVFFGVNLHLFSHHFVDVLAGTKKTEIIINYISKNISTFPQHSLIIVGPTRDFGPYDADFFTYHIGKKNNIIFKTDYGGKTEWQHLALSSKHLLYLSFDSECYCVRQREIN